jgi:hypothetical protein
MDCSWKSSVGRPFTIRTPGPSTVVRVTALETGLGSSTWVWLANATARQWVHYHPANPTRPTTLEETLRSSYVYGRALAASFFALGVALTMVPIASADDSGTDASSPGPVVNTPVDPSDNATEPAVSACATFAQVLDDASNYYGDFADEFETSNYADPAVDSSNAMGRTGLRQDAATAMQTADTPGLDPSISEPMRIWSLGATKLLLEMGLRIPGDSLNSTATQMNAQAIGVQKACAAAGTHA